LEDHSQIALFGTGKESVYEYRALLLASKGDLVAIGVKRNLKFESYCHDALGLGEATIVTPRPGPEPLALRCAEDSELIAKIATTARISSGLNVVPYMGTGSVWKLAGRISAATGLPVRVAAPPPRLARRVNDKLWFATQVDNAHVAVKVPSSASSVGNVVLDSKCLTGLSLKQLRDRLDCRLRRTGWLGEFPLMVTAWEDPILASPSVQLWIPKRKTGEVVVEGIFDQSVAGLARTFSGAQPSSLSAEWQARLAEEASRIGTVFQILGYFGRCSFDAIVVGESQSNARLHWLECNGRWGGTSIPMTLANRLVGDWEKRPFVIIDRDNLHGHGQEIGAFLKSISEDLYLQGRRDHGVVLLSPG
jgi:hypothetical protein